MNSSLVELAVGLIAGSRKLTIDDLQNVPKIVEELRAWLKAVFPFGPEKVDQLTYDQAIRYFVEQRPEDSTIEKGALLLQDDPAGTLVYQVFLNIANELVCDVDGRPFGRHMIVGILDVELIEAFDGRQLLIVE